MFKTIQYGQPLTVVKGKLKGETVFPVSQSLLGMLVAVGGLDIPTTLKFNWNLKKHDIL